MAASKLIYGGKRLLAMGLLALATACGPAVPKPEPRILTPVAKSDTVPQDQTPLADRVTEDVVDSKIRVAILLPLSGPEAPTGRALLRAATMALFDAYDPRLVLLPFDTKADYSESERVARLAIDSGADIVLGPLLSANVTAAGTVLVPTGIPLIGFSNDQSVALPGRFIFGFTPENEVERVVDYAVDSGHMRFAALLPEGLYGNRVRAAFGETVSDDNATISAMESYPPDPNAVFDPVKRLANYDARKKALRDEINFLRNLRDDTTDEIAKRLDDAEELEPVDFDAVLVPEGGELLRTVAPLLPFYEVDPLKVKLLGTGLWNDTSLFREPSLQGAWFAAPMPEGPEAFRKRYSALYGEAAPRLASMAYDAMSLVAALARDDLKEGESRFSVARLTYPLGFSGVDGLFRLLPDGTNERALAVLELSRGGLKVVDAAPKAFPAFGYGFRQSASQAGN